MDEYIGKNVVVDVESMYVYLGLLKVVGDKSIVLKDVDVHDLRDSTTTREAYIRVARLHGIQPNRKRVQVRMEQIVSLSMLDDVIE